MVFLSIKVFLYFSLAHLWALSLFFSREDNTALRLWKVTAEIACFNRVMLWSSLPLKKEAFIFPLFFFWHICHTWLRGPVISLILELILVKDLSSMVAKLPFASVRYVSIMLSSFGVGGRSFGAGVPAVIFSRISF